MTDHRLTVLQSSPPPRPTTNPYIVMLHDRLRSNPETNVLAFGWRTALFARYDVFHVHWPEILVSGRTPIKKVVRQVLTASLLVRLRIRRIPIVRTVHNLELPEGISRREILLLKAFDRHTGLRILINSETRLPDDLDSVTIPHGHYRDWFALHEASPVIRGQLGFAGLVRRYKGVERLIRSFIETSSTAPSLSLRVGGAASSPELKSEVERLAEGDNRIRLDLHFLSDAELVGLVTSSELVVLPYTFMHNSGGALTALSLGRPVLVPDNPVNRALSKEVGAGWVWCYDGDIDATAIVETIAKLRGGQWSESPNLDSRRWDDAASSHTDAYRLAVRSARRSPASKQNR